MSTKIKLIIVLGVVIFLSASASALAMYIHTCKQELREVDRYAQPYIIEVMEALATWKYATIEPLLTTRYKSLLTPEEWQTELDELSVLGGLQSFGRPRFVSHTPFKKWAVCESAIDIYSISTEYEAANAQVLLRFENTCGKLEVNSFKVVSNVLHPKPTYLHDDAVIQTKPTPKSATSNKHKPKGKIYRY